MVILKEGRELVEGEDVANLPAHKVRDRAVQAQVQEETKRGRKLRRVQVVQVVLVVAVLKELPPNRVKVPRPRANLCRAWHPSRGGISTASPAKGVLEGQVRRQVREDRDVLQSKAVVDQANLVVAPSKGGSLVVRVAPRPKGMTGSLEALPRMSHASGLQKHPAVTAKSIQLRIS